MAPPFVNPLQYVPPVYSALRWRGIRSALWNTVHETAEATLQRAAERVQQRYPAYQVQLTDSGTSALTLALHRTADTLAARRLVALPAYACPDIATAAIGAGFSIMLYDVDPANFEPDLASVEACLNAGARHVVAVHLYGRLVDVPGVCNLAARYGATVIEDAAQHAGGTRNGVRGGAQAPVAILSFGRGKGLNAGGGGALLQQQPVAHDAGAQQGVSSGLLRESRMASLRGFSVAVMSELLAHPWVYALPASIPAFGIGRTQYQSPHPMHAMSPLLAALLIDALESEPHLLAARRRHEHAYEQALEQHAQRRFDPPPPHVQSGALRYPVRITAYGDGGLPHQLARLGVARSYPYHLADYHAIRPHLIGTDRPLPGAKALAASTYTLPTHARITPAIRQQIVAQLTQRP